MLAHSSPLPLAIYFEAGPDFTKEDGGGIVLALEQGDRVRYVFSSLLRFCRRLLWSTTRSPGRAKQAVQLCQVKQFPHKGLTI